MTEYFGNVKGFGDAVEILTTEERSDLLMLITDREFYKDQWYMSLELKSPCISSAALALAHIYFAHNEAE